MAPTGRGRPFLAGVTGAEPKLAKLKRESDDSYLINHDATHFPGWRIDDVYEHHVRTFTDGQRKAEITNIDADPLEGLFGRTTTNPAEWRLGSDACFFKLAKSTPMNPYSDKLVDGLYLPACYVHRVIEARTPGNTVGRDA